MAINRAKLKAIIMQRAMARLELGVRAGGEFITAMLKDVVSRPGTDTDAVGPTAQGTFQWHPEAYKGKVPTNAKGSPIKLSRRSYQEGDPPYMRTGHGKNSIGFQIIRNPSQYSITLRIGVDEQARSRRSGFLYFWAWTMGGIMYPTRGSGRHVVYRRWLQPTLKKYHGEFISRIMGTARGTQ